MGFCCHKYSNSKKDLKMAATNNRPVISTQTMSSNNSLSSDGIQSSALAIPFATATFPDTNAPYSNSPNISDAAGRRVRLRPKPASAAEIYGTDGLLQPLVSGSPGTSGLVFPYQPQITYAQDVQYSDMELIHTNQELMAYKRTPALRLAVDGEFTVQSPAEGRYAMACIHFLRTVSKMYFGDNSGIRQGAPPPVLLFDAYGTYMFNALPVIVTQFSVTLPKDVDYVPVDVSNNQQSQSNAALTNLTASYFGGKTSNQYVWLPALFNISIQLVVQNTPRRLRSFNLDQFRSGFLLSNGGWA